MTYQDLQGNLHNILTGCATQIEKLVALLQEEHEALTARDVAAVEACTKRKHELLAQLEILDRQRNEASVLLDNHNEAGNNGVATDDDFTELKQQRRRCWINAVTRTISTVRLLISAHNSVNGYLR